MLPERKDAVQSGGYLGRCARAPQRPDPQRVTSDGIEPPLSDLESEVLPLHHEASEPAWACVGLRGPAWASVWASVWIKVARTPQICVLASSHMCTTPGFNPGLSVRVIWPV